jgi:type I restriction enzyme S subunit
MPEQFKDSAFGRIPKGWEIKSLAVLASEITSGATPTSGSARYYCDAGGLPFAKIDDLTASSTRFLERTSLQVTRAALRETALVEYPAGTLLLSMYGTIGLVKTTARPMCANQALAAIIPPFSCDPSFLAHVLEWSRPKWDRFKAQTTQANINGRIVKDFLLAVPPEEEQRRIADILDTVDDAIRQTERVIAKLEQVKSGMRQDLLTRGIDDNGEVRDPERHPEQFKDSPLGRIPKGWDVVSLKSVVQADRPITYGIVQPGAFHGGGIPMIRGQDYSGGVVDARALFHVHPSVAAGYRRSVVRGGDLLLSIVGYVGLTAVVPGQLGGANLTQTTARIAISPRHSARFFLHYFRGRSFRREIVRYTKGSAQPGLNLADVERFQVLCPPQPEQERVARSLDQQNDQLSDERTALAKLRAMKQAISDDLLTGRVRVNTPEGVPA